MAVPFMGRDHGASDLVGVRPVQALRVPWSWGSKISVQLIWDGLHDVNHLFVGTVLDVGCGMKPYQRSLGGRVHRWIGLDFASTPSGNSAANVFGNALQLPFSAAAFDTIISTQVLEHVSQPEALLREAHRVLKPGGHLVLTAPQTNPLHEEPHDYFRFTCHGLRLLAEQAGFSVLETKSLGGAIATVGQMIIWHLNWVRRMPLLGAIASKCLNASLAWLTMWLDQFSPTFGLGATKDTLNWLMVARKRHPC